MLKRTATKRFIIWLTTLLLLVSAFTANSLFIPTVTAAAQATYYVSPTGSDTNPGTESAPFQTITKARDVVRTINKDMSGDIYVYLRGGMYNITGTIAFGPQDSGTNGYRIYYKAYQDEKPVLNGATKVTGWTQHSGNIYKASLNRSTKLRNLYVNDRRALMTSKTVTARGGYGTYSVTAGQASWAWTSGSKSDGVQYNTSDVPAVSSNKDDLEIVNGTTWNENIVCTRDVITSGNYRVLLLQQPYGAIAQTPGWGAAFGPSGTHTIYNAFEFLNSPGQFYFDKTTKTLYYYMRPGENMATADVEAPVVEKLMDIAGTSTSNRVKNITFQGITFENTDYSLVNVAGSHGKSTCQAAQAFIAFYNDNWHNTKYDLVDTLPGMINVSNSDSINFTSDIVKHSGSDGISMVNDVINSNIVGCYITDITSSGITVGHPQHVYIGNGGNRAKYATGIEGICKNNTITNNFLYETSTAPGFGGCAAITAYFVDSINITYNHVQSTAYNGIHLGWGWCNFLDSTTCKNNTVSYNRIIDTLTRLHDSGAIYTIGQMPGTNINQNYIRGIPPATSGPTYGLHNDEGTAYINENDNVLDIDPGVKYTINCEDYGQKHDLTILRTYATVNKMGVNPPNSKIDKPVVVSDNVWPLAQYNTCLNSGIKEEYRSIIPESLLSTQDYVFPASCATTAATRLNIRSSGNSSNSVWFAPSGTTSFVEGPAKTKAAGDATSITVPYTAGTYKLFVVDSQGKKLGESAAILRVSGSAVYPSASSSVTPSSTPVPGTGTAFIQMEAEDYDNQSGIQTESCNEGGKDVGYIENGDYVVYNNIDFGSGAESFQARVASAAGGGNIEIRLDSITGPLVGTCPVTGNGDWQTYVDATCDISGASGTHDLYLKFTGGSGYLFNLNWWKFIYAPSSPTSTPTPVISIDVNHDGAINISDVMIVAGAFNSARGDSRYVEAYDLNSDGAVNITDIMMIAAKFNTLVTVTNTPTVTSKPTPTPTSVSPSSDRPSYRKIGNPYLPGWEYIPDGEPRVFGNRLYVYGSHDNANSSKFCDTKLRVWSAPIDDLENWRDEGDAFHSKADDEGIDSLPYTDNDLYAPDVVEKGGKYYLYYYVVGAAGGVAVSDSPAGPFKYLSKYVNGNNGSFADPGVLVDTDGSVYMYYGYQGSYMCQMNPNDMYTILPNTTINNLVSTSAPFYFFEAASIRKVENTYYLIYSPNNATTTLVYATSSSPKGPFKYRGTIINSGKNYPGANDHGSICNINGQWYIFYHRMTNNTMYSRKGCVEKINILPDGSIPEVEMTSMGFSNSLSPYQSNPADLSCYLTGGNYSTEVDTNTRPVINNKNNAVIGFKYFDFTRTNTSTQTTFSAKIRYGKTAGKMEIRLDNPTTGSLIGTLDIGSKPGDTKWYTLSTNVSNVTGSHALYFRFTGAATGDSICDLASFEFK